MKMSEAFPSPYVQAHELQGRDVKVQIHSVTMEIVGNPPENLPVVHFANTKKSLVLNKTNGNTIAALHGDDTDLWNGKEVTLYATTTEFGGKIVPCIRVRSPLELANQQVMNGNGQDQPQQQPAQQQPVQQADPLATDLDDAIPF